MQQRQRRRQRRTWFLALAGALLLAPAGVGSAAAEEPTIEPQAAATLKAALDRVASAESLAFRAEIINDVALPSGEKIQFPGVLEAAVRRPDRMRIRYDSEQRATHSWYDGRNFFLLSPEANTYASCPGPARLDDLFTQLRDTYGFAPPLAILLRADVADRVLSRVRTGHTVGRGKVAGVESTHLAFRGEFADWQVWVSAAGDPVLMRLVITWKQEPSAPQFVATFLSWDFNAQLADADFAFAPPADAVRCELEGLAK